MLNETRRDSAGFRLRGTETTRIETFTDAAFAFALTLLVISMDPPSSFGELRQALAGIPAFVLSATMLMTFWWGHHEWSRRYGLDDVATLVLSCVLVFTVLVYVYPLRFMAGVMVAWVGQLAGSPMPAGARIGFDEVNSLFLLYGIGFATMSGAILLLNLHAWRMREALVLDEEERVETLSSVGAWGILATAGLASSLVAAVVPPTMVGAPGWVYSLLGMAMPFYGRMVRRTRARRPAGGELAVGRELAP